MGEILELKKHVLVLANSHMTNYKDAIRIINVSNDLLRQKPREYRSERTQGYVEMRWYGYFARFLKKNSKHASLYYNNGGRDMYEGFSNAYIGKILKMSDNVLDLVETDDIIKIVNNDNTVILIYVKKVNGMEDYLNISGRFTKQLRVNNDTLINDDTLKHVKEVILLKSQPDKSYEPYWVKQRWLQA